MRWLLDQGLPRSTATLLNEASQDALHVGDIGMAEAHDSSILRHAEEEDRIIVTLDADFHALLALSGSSRPSVIRIREEGLKGPAVAALLLRIARQFKAELESGCMMTFHSGKIRLRALPLS
jgi:predicted nuclease of predicted toxin-antitoxin system